MLSDSSAMGIDSSTTLSWPPNRRSTLTPARLRLREERRRIINALETKCRTIDDERGMRRFVLIRNNLRRLQREAREEKLARHRSNLTGGSGVSNLSPSCLSASRSPSPISDYPYVDSPAPFAESEGGAGTPAVEEDPPLKRPRLFFDDDKENEKMEIEGPDGPHFSKSATKNPLDDSQDILRDLYETCANDGLAGSRQSTASPTPSTSNSSCSNSYSFSMSASCSVTTASSDSCSNSSFETEWHKPSPYHLTCLQTSLLRNNDLESVVYHSILTSLDS